MSNRVSPAERLRAEADKVFAGGEDLSRAIERVAQLGAQSALEAEVTVFFGRDRYERATAGDDPRAGYAQWVLLGDSEDHCGPDEVGPAEAAQHHRAVRQPAVR